jgi:phage terminase small subunit
MKGRQPSTGTRSKPPKGELTPRHKLFIEEYVKDCNGTEAYLRAGYKCSRKSAGVAASALLAKPEIRTILNKRLEEIRASRQREAEAFLRNTMAVATSDIRQAFDDTGRLLPVNEWPDELALAVSSLDVEEIQRARDGDEEAELQVTRKLRLWSKTSALDLLGRFAGVIGAKEQDRGRVTVRIVDYTGRQMVEVEAE